MSIAALQDASRELRRLSIAGSALARDDFRVRKLIPILQKSGEKAPVFSRVAGTLEELLSAPEADTPRLLLQAATLVHAVLYTQVQNKVEGESVPLEPFGIVLSTKPAAAKSIRTVIEALGTSGGGRIVIVEEAIKGGMFEDIRLLKPALASLDDPYPELADMMCEKVLPRYGRGLVPILRKDFNPKGGTGDRRRLKLLGELSTPEDRRALFREVADLGDKEMRTALVRAIDNDPEFQDILAVLVKDRSQDVRTAVYTSLAKVAYEQSQRVLVDALSSKDSETVAKLLQGNLMESLVPHCLKLAQEYLQALKDGKKGYTASTFMNFLSVLPKSRHDGVATFLKEVHEARKQIAELKSVSKGEPAGGAILRRVRHLLGLGGGDPEKSEEK